MFERWRLHLGKICKELVFLVPGLVIVPVQWLFLPWVQIKLCMVRSDRLGHFIGESDLRISQAYKADACSGKRRFWVIHFFSSRPVNDTFAQVLREKLLFWPAPLLRGAFLLNQVIPGGARFIAQWPKVQGMPDLSDLSTSKSWFTFSSSDDARAREALAQLGLEPEDKYVCLYLRDPSYGISVAGKRREHTQRFRNCSLQSFELATEFLVTQGYKVVRMGRGTRDTPRASSPSIIDYAHSESAGPLEDLYISAHCAFAISCETGAALLPALFRRPLALVNVSSPWGLWQGSSVSRYLMKSWTNSIGEELRLLDLLFLGKEFAPMGPDGSFFDSQGLQCRDNTAFDILSLTMEMSQIVEQAISESREITQSCERVGEILSLRKPGNWRINFPSQWLNERPSFLST